MSRLLLLGAGAGGGGPALWNPSNESSLLAWFDTSADRYDGTTWTKRYGSGNNAAKAVTGPTESTTAFGGSQRALVFTGNSDTGLVLTPASTTEFINVLVMKLTTIAANATVMERHTATNMRLIAFSGSGLRAAYLAGGDADDFGAVTTNPAIIVSRHSKASRIVRFEGVQIISSAVATSGTETTTLDFRLGGYSGGAINWTAEVTVWALFHNSGWTTTLAEKIEGFIAHDGGLGVSTANLPVGHAYKSTAPTV